MSGVLVDTLAYQVFMYFAHNDKSFLYYDYLPATSSISWTTFPRTSFIGWHLEVVPGSGEETGIKRKRDKLSCALSTLLRTWKHKNSGPASRNFEQCTGPHFQSEAGPLNGPTRTYVRRFREQKPLTQRENYGPSTRPYNCK